nr:hypothetical protein [Mycobacterium tilburgii]
MTTRELARVQARRWMPTAMIQAVQRTIHAQVVADVLSGRTAAPPRGVLLVDGRRRYAG